MSVVQRLPARSASNWARFRVFANFAIASSRAFEDTKKIHTNRQKKSNITIPEWRRSRRSQTSRKRAIDSSNRVVPRGLCYQPRVRQQKLTDKLAKHTQKRYEKRLIQSQSSLEYTQSLVFKTKTKIRTLNKLAFCCCFQLPAKQKAKMTPLRSNGSCNMCRDANRYVIYKKHQKISLV